MKLELREIASAMVGPIEPLISLQVPSREGMSSLAQQIPLRKVLKEMGSIDATATRPHRGTGTVLNASLTRRHP